jgi:hypothetical protein
MKPGDVRERIGGCDVLPSLRGAAGTTSVIFGLFSDRKSLDRAIQELIPLLFQLSPPLQVWLRRDLIVERPQQSLECLTRPRLHLRLLLPVLCPCRTLVGRDTACSDVQRHGIDETRVGPVKVVLVRETETVVRDVVPYDDTVLRRRAERGELNQILRMAE